MTTKTEALWLHTLPGGWNWTIRVPCYVVRQTAKRVKIEAKKLDGTFEERWVKPEKLVYQVWSEPTIEKTSTVATAAPFALTARGTRKPRRVGRVRMARGWGATRCYAQEPKSIAVNTVLSPAEFVIGLMKQGYNVEPNQLGFIPAPKIEHYYIPREQYAIQLDNRGRQVGYILTGSYIPGKLLKIEQAIIDIDRRNIGFGEMAVLSIIERSRQANMRGIVLRCAEDLESNAFWQAMGFMLTGIRKPHNKRRRAVNVYTMDLWPTLWQVPAGACKIPAGAGEVVR